MVTYKFLSGPYEGREPSEHWAVRCDKEELDEIRVAMANPPAGCLRRPMYPVEEVFEGMKIRRWVEYAS